MEKRHHTAVNSLLVLTLAILGAAIVILCLVPPISRDALIHHLAIPKLYIQHGSIFEIPDLSFSYYPMNLDLLYMIPLYFKNDILPKYIHFAFALLTTRLIYGYLKNKLSRTYGLLGSLFFLSIPIIIKLSITVYVDLGLVFFSTASLLLLFRWTEEEHSSRYLITAAICCGLATGIKYNSLISFFLLTTSTPLLYIRCRDKNANNLTALKYGIYFIGIALLIASPWFIRNYLWTGNPLFPLYQNIFNPEIVHSGQGMGIFSVRKVFFHESLLQILLLPFRIFFEGSDNNPQYFDGKLNPFLLLLPLFAFFSKLQQQKTKIQIVALAIFSILFLFIATFQSSMRIRYIAPIIPPLVILSMFGLHNIVTFFHKYKDNHAGSAVNVIISLIFTAMLLYNINYLIGQFHYVQPFQYIFGKVNRDTYITRYRPEYPVIQFANHHVDKKAKVLCLFLGKRGYYMDFSHKFYVPSNKNSTFSQLVTGVSSPAAIQQILHKSGYRYILLRDNLTNSWLDSLQQQKEIAVFFFQHHLSLIYSAGGYSLFQIKH